MVEAFANNVFRASSDGALFGMSNPGSVLVTLSRVAPSRCSAIFTSIESDPSMLDKFVMAVLGSSYDSHKGRAFSLPKDTQVLTPYCSLQFLKELARMRLADIGLDFPERAAWQAVVEEKALYAVDGTERW